MAITRSQQYKQMLQDGGRIGLQGGGADMGTVSTPSRAARDNREIGARMARTASIGQGDDIRRNREEFEKAVGKANLERLRVKDIDPAIGPMSMAINLLKGPRQKLLSRNLDFYRFDPRTKKAREKYGLDAAGYEAYVKARLAGEIDAAGNPLGIGSEGFYPDEIIFPQNAMAQASGIMDQGTSIMEDDIKNYRLLADGGRAAFRIGSDSGKDISGREYASDTAASKSVATSPSRNIGVGGNNNQPSQKNNISKTIKNVGNTAGELMFLKNVFELNPAGIMKNIGTKLIFDKLMSEADTKQNQNMMLADVSAMDLRRKNQFKNLDYGTAMDIGMINPTMTQEEFEGIKSGNITEPTGQFVRDGGRIGAMDGGIMDLEQARQGYKLGKLVKKATRAVKKIVKSPIGKAALLYTGLGGLGSIAGGKTFFANFMNPMSQLKGIGSIFKAGGLDNIMSGLKLGKFVGPPSDRVLEKNFLGKLITSPTGLITGTSLLSGLLTKQQEDDEDEEVYRGPRLDMAAIESRPYDFLNPRLFAEGGSTEKEPVAKKTMPLLDMGGMEKDYRKDGGFVPIGRMEKADDVPARLSKNEFVFTADAVRNAGDGDVDKGAEVMYNMMKNLEAGGNVSEESQGLDGARKMFQTSQRLEEVL